MMTDLSIFSTVAGSYKSSPINQPLAWLMESLFPDNCILFADFLVGLALYKIVMFSPRDES